MAFPPYARTSMVEMPGGVSRADGCELMLVGKR